MSAINSVDTKAGDAKAAPELKSALTPAVATAKKGLWGALSGKQKLGAIVGGTVLAVAGGMFAIDHFRPAPPRAQAQAGTSSEAPPAPAEEPKGRPVPMRNDLPDIPDVTAPAPVKPAKYESTEPPAIPTIKFADDDPPIKAPVPGGAKNDDQPTVDLPAVKAAALPDIPDLPKKTDDEPYKLPSIPGDKKDDRTRKRDDDFKPSLGPSPAPLPAAVTGRKDKADDGGPVIRIGGQDVVPPPAPGKKEDAPKIDFDATAPPAPRSDVKPDPAKPMIPDLNDDLPTVTAPTIGPAPKSADPPARVMPMKEKPPAKESDLPTIKLPGIDVPSVPVTDTPRPTPKADERKENYSEDWHTPRSGDSMALISKEYYNSADYAAALEAYNKERRKAGEGIIRVPPVWVLEERFPDMVKKADDKPATDAKPGGLKFEPVEPARGGSRPAPPPAATGGSSPEYKVTAEAGETIREVARKVYGDPNAWRRIWDMNSGIDPTQPIPVGTTLRLPK
jgi:hypothetical protein